MRFTFLHAADLHLGSPLKGLAQKDAAVAARLAATSRDAFSDLVSRALEEQVAFVLIAGDIYDREWKDMAIGLFFNREIARLARAGIPVLIIKGNHDADSEVESAVPLPGNVTVFSARTAQTERLEALRVAVHGRSFPNRAVTENYALAYPAAIPGWFNIGLLHTSLDGSANHDPYAPCSLEDLKSRGYDYWALGHIHEHAVRMTHPHVVYPGNLQGRSIRETGPKGAVLVDVEDGAVRALRPVHVDRARWFEIAVDLAAATEEIHLRMAAEAALAPVLAAHADRLLLLRIRLTGATELHHRLARDPAGLAVDMQALASHGHGDVWLEKLVVATTAPQLAVPLAVSEDVFAELAALKADPEIRAGALRLIDQLAAKGLDLAVAEEMKAEIDVLLAEAEAGIRARTGVL